MKRILVAAVSLLLCLLPARNATATAGDNDATRATLAGIKQFSISAHVYDEVEGQDQTAPQTLAIEAALKAQGMQVLSQSAANKLPGQPFLYVWATRYLLPGGNTVDWINVSLRQTIWLDRSPKVGLTGTETWGTEFLYFNRAALLSDEITNQLDAFIVAYQAVN